MDVYALILAGGESSSLSALGEARPTAAMPFAGKYRIIDFTLSNCSNSGVADVAVLTQYRPHSLHEHVSSGRPWDLDRTRGGIHIWQPYRGRSDQGWQRGTADALYQNRDFITEADCDTLMVLSGDHIYKQDYRAMVRQHEDTQADVTIAVRNVPREQTSRFGIVSTNSDGRIVGFHEKPQTFQGTLASMGVYLFRTSFLLEKLDQDAGDPDSQHDFGRNIIPSMIAEAKVQAYTFDNYWMDVGTIPSYWQANLDLLADRPALDLYDQRWTIHTRSEERPPVKLGRAATIERSLISNGCIVAGTVINSVLSPGVIVEEGAVIRDSVVMNDTLIEAGAHVERCILDKQVVVGRNAVLGEGENVPNQHEPEYLRDGITILGKSSRIPAGFHIGKNCRVDAKATAGHFSGTELPSGASVLVPER
jgi:glucose-1-phosphate adenylyltransferase